jgi:hypothetical protein
MAIMEKQDRRFFEGWKVNPTGFNLESGGSCISTPEGCHVYSPGF